MLFFNPHGRIRNPATGGDSRRRPPEGREGKISEIGLQLFSHIHGRGIDVKNLTAVGRVYWTGRDREIRARIHIEPPEQLGAGELRIPVAKDFPELGTFNKMIRLLPELMFCKSAVIPSIGNYSVLTG